MAGLLHRHVFPRPPAAWRDRMSQAVWDAPQALIGAAACCRSFASVCLTNIQINSVVCFILRVQIGSRLSNEGPGRRSHQRQHSE